MGISAEDAIDKMSNADCKCNLKQNEIVQIHKDNIKIGETQPLDFIYCTLESKIENIKEWQITLLLDDQGTVQYVSVASARINL